MRQQLAAEQAALAGMRRSREAFVAVWAERRARSGAARTVQRRFRAWRLARLLTRTSLDAKVQHSPPLASCVRSPLRAPTPGGNAHFDSAVCICSLHETAFMLSRAHVWDR